MPSDIVVDILTIVVAISAVGISIYTFVKKQKSDQFRIALDINYRLEETTDEIIQAVENAGIKFQSYEREEFLKSIKQPQLKLLNIYEFFSFLVINGEITNTTIIKY
jgi:hypothetical protein